MYQQHSVGWINGLLAPKVGIGALAVSVAAAFAGGVIAVSLLAGHTSTGTATSVAVPAHRGPSVGDVGSMPQSIRVSAPAAPRLLTLNVQDFGTTPRVIAAPAGRSGLSVQDFGVPAGAIGTVSVPAIRSGLSVEDFGTMARSIGTIIAVPALRSGLSVEDFGTAPQAITTTVAAPASRSGLSAEDFGTMASSDTR